MTDTINTFLEGNLSKYINLLHAMVDINTFTANRDGINRLGKLGADLFCELGLNAEFIPSVNPDFGRHVFLANKSAFKANAAEEDLRSIALIAHLDTVFSPEEEEVHDFHFRIEGERIYGPGTVDIKGGIVMIFAVLETIKKYQPDLFSQVNWLVGLDASEETLSDDFGRLMLERIPKNASGCLVFEGGTPNRQKVPLVVSRKGRAEFKVSTDGRGAHAGNYHKQGANAIIQMADVLPKIASFTSYPDDITFNVGVVNGGSVVNRVPHHAEALVEMRAFSSQVFEHGLEQMAALDGASTVTSGDGYPCRVSVETVSINPPWPENSETDKLYEIWKKVGEQSGHKITREKRGGLSDGNLLWKHVPVLDGLGPSGTNAHCSERSEDRSKDQEYMLLPSFVPKTLLNVQAIMKLCGLEI